MKLCYSPTSPYVRKVTMTALETGTHDQIERELMFPAGPATDVAKFNPLGKVPALILDDGSVLYDSPVICEYLDAIGGADLFPKNGPERWSVLRLQALADGALDAGVLILMEGRRPEHERSPDWVTRQKLAKNQALDAMEVGVESLSQAVTIAHITFSAALGWFDFRFADDDWRHGRPALADWYAAYSARASVMATEPKDPV